MKKLSFILSFVLVLLFCSCEPNVSLIGTGVKTVNKICVKLSCTGSGIRSVLDKSLNENGNDDNKSSVLLLPANVWNTKMLF